VRALACAVFLVAIGSVGSLRAQTIFDDSFADGDRAATGAMDTNWWTSSSSAGIEASVGSLGLVTGTSGRGIHTVFPTQTLVNVGDKLTATYTFTTPATIGMSSSSFRVGIFDTLGRALDEDITASSSMPNAVYGLAGTADGLPGYMMDMDVNTGSAADLNFREHDATNLTPSGRLLATSTGFTSFTSGPDMGYMFAPSTSYTGSISVKLVSPTEIELTGMIDGQTYRITDDSFASASFGFLGFHANSNVFGSSGAAGDPDNGIDFTNISVVFTPAPPVQTVFDDSFADGDRAATGATDTDWWTSSSSAGIEASTGSLGLVTGSSGRGIHTVFPTQTLTEVGDKIVASYTFTTPATVGTNLSSAFRVGMFDTLGRSLDEDISASSSSPNAVYGLAGQADGLPGYMMDMDVNTGASADLNFREHDASDATPTGRLMATTSGFSSLGSGPDVGYSFAPNTVYEGTFSIELISATELAISGSLNGDSFSVIDDTFASASFGFFGFHANGSTFGSSNAAGDPDNGIDFSNIAVEVQLIQSGGIVTVNPSSFNVLHGTYASGGLSDLTASDNSDLSARRNSSDIQSRVTIEVEATSPTAFPTSMDFTLESSVFARSTVNQNLELFNYDTSSWELVDTRAAMRLIDSTVTVTPTGDLSRFVEPGTLAIEARVRYVSPAQRQSFSGNVDQMVWEIGN
ncbi:MAG: hypothetical protein AAF456_24555, partial [Planctomycetota bacterium]